MVAVLEAAPGHEEALTAAIKTLTAAVNAEPGCVEFRSFVDAGDPWKFYLFEMYDDVDAFQTHLGLPHVARFFEEPAEHSTSDARALTQ